MDLLDSGFQTAMFHGVLLKQRLSVAQSLKDANLGRRLRLFSSSQLWDWMAEKEGGTILRREIHK